MSSKKISEFPELEAIDVTNDDVMPIVNDSVNKKFSWANIKTALNSVFLQKSSNLSDVASATSARNNILPSKSGNSLKVLRVNSGETDYELASISSGITIGSTAISSGTAGRLIFQGSGNVIQQSSNLFWDESNSRLGLGVSSSLQARLHVKGPGDLSSDKIIVAQNASGDVLLETLGNGVTYVRNALVVDSVGYYPNISFTNVGGHNGNISMYYNIFYFLHNGTQSMQLSYAEMTMSEGVDIGFGTTSGSMLGSTSSQKIGMWGATPIVQPTTSVGAATLTGGGGTTLTDTDTFDGYTIKQVVKALRNMGILA